MENNKITREEAIRLLFENRNESTSSPNVFDIYGNYIFPTEITTDTPNIAIGTTQINIKRHLEKV
ncbi:TPA: hypothetical protein IAC10_05020 [Candidatus Scatousia excrementigallinarum]|uniref:Uncharacterized protein n=1 Tax=Candidatus Scatousia excrementigallinarum TaxID=2840935 RepID=A0A9D1JMJ7_9BACT|nr:hypothetical protein [Candidatus Scatousia excrementigallinarum]